MSFATLNTLTDADWSGANPLSPEFRDNPYPALKHLRETSPVNRTPLGPWRISRYRDIADVFKRATTGMTLSDGSNPNFDPLDQRGSFREFMLNKDGAEHLRLRRLVTKAFTLRALQDVQAEIDVTVDTAIDSALAGGGMDVITDLALAVPSRMICRIMGVPEADRHKFTEWTAARTNAFFGAFLPAEIQAEVRAAGVALADYFDDLTAARRLSLSDDLLSELIRAEEDGDRLKPGELAVQAIGLLVAGFETTIGLIGNGLRTLITHPEQYRQLRADPTLVDQAIEECLRFDTPILFNWRMLREPFVIDDIELPADSILWLMLGAGNRDPEQFERPDEFDITRRDVKHLSFGGGTHYCLGHQLARMEARSAIARFVSAVAKPRIENAGVAWSPSFFRVLGALPVTFD